MCIEEQLCDLFTKSAATIALAESCTGGMIAERLTSVAGSSRYFKESAVTYSNEAKVRQLSISPELIASKGAVSPEVAEAMAKGIRLAAGSNLGLAVTGIAGPDGGTLEKPVGTVFISLAAADGCWVKRFQFSGSRQEIRILTTCTALDWLRSYILSNNRADLTAAV